jgi:hypothetical protein
VTNSKAIRFHPSQDNANGITDYRQKNRPGCQPTRQWFFENPEGDI